MKSLNERRADAGAGSLPHFLSWEIAARRTDETRERIRSMR
jgi:hypothetical protein